MKPKDTKRKANVRIRHPGGNAGPGSLQATMILPISWVKEMGISQDSREVIIKFKNKKIMIKKADPEDKETE